MREIISPIGNPDRKWVKDLTFNLCIRIRGSERVLTATHTKDKFWAGTVECYHLETEKPPAPADLIICHVFRVFGKELALQDWGFADDFRKDISLRAVCLGGKWFLIEKEDAVEIITPNRAPFQEISLALHNKDGVMTQVYKR